MAKSGISKEDREAARNTIYDSIERNKPAQESYSLQIQLTKENVRNSKDLNT